MVHLPKPDTDYLQSHHKKIMPAMHEYKDLTGERWPPYNPANEYKSAESWYKALIEAITKAKQLKRTTQ